LDPHGTGGRGDALGGPDEVEPKWWVKVLFYSVVGIVGAIVLAICMIVDWFVLWN
jgi:hypothetical protein